ncbi:MAG: tetratricopeptide repeat protein [Bacteroidota bacterium]
MIKKGLFLIFVFSLFFESINAQIPKTLDSLKSYLKAAPKDTNYVLALNDYAFFMIQEGKFEEAKKSIAQMDEITKKLDFGTGYYKTINMFGVVEYSQQNFEKALDYFIQSSKIIQKYKLQKKYYQNCISNISIIYGKLGNRENATKYAMELIDYQEKNKLNPLKSSPYEQIGDNLKFYKKYDEALKYYNKALAIEIDNNNLTGMAIQENNIGNLYDDLKNNKVATQHYEKGLKYAEKENYKLLQTDFLTNLGRMYFEGKDYAKSEKYLKKSEQICIELGNEKPLKTIYHNMGELYFSQKKYPISEQYYLKALAISKTIEDPESGYNANQALAELYEETGDFKKALNYKKLAEVAKDSLFKIETAQTTEDLLKKYETTQKEQQIALLNEKNEKSSLQNKSLLGGLGLLALALGLLFWNLQIKKKSQKIVAAKNVVLEKLNTELQEANQTKAKLFGIISHDLRSPISQVYQFLKLQELNPNLLDEKQKTDLSSKIQTATGSLLETMEDLLLWSKTQLSQFKINPEPVLIKPVVEQCLDLMKLNTDAKKIEVKFNIPSDYQLFTDSYFLQIIVRNLLQNAIKASPENGEIFINTEKSGQISILNSGAIFTQKDYENILNNPKKQENLYGLGLKLVDELSQKINAKIVFETLNNQTKANILFS